MGEIRPQLPNTDHPSGHSDWLPALLCRTSASKVAHALAPRFLDTHQKSLYNEEVQKTLKTAPAILRLPIPDFGKSLLKISENL
jgi:hypothetical protein